MQRLGVSCREDVSGHEYSDRLSITKFKQKVLNDLDCLYSRLSASMLIFSQTKGINPKDQSCEWVCPLILWNYLKRSLKIYDS